MCGIIGYAGQREALPIVIHGLKQMEYRGYDSSGIVVVQPDGTALMRKAVGHIANLEKTLGETRVVGTVGCGHTRWATHGGVTENNAHPHAGCPPESQPDKAILAGSGSVRAGDGRFFVVHNGIIENYKDLKTELLVAGHRFHSETDSEVLAHLIEETRKNRTEAPLEAVVREALARVVGTYGIIVIDSEEPGKLVAARFFSPLLIGIGDGEFFVASDASAVLKYTRQVAYLDNGDIAVVTPESYTVYDAQNRPVTKKIEQIDWSYDEVQKAGHAHFMHKEIFEQPEAIENALRGRLLPEGIAQLPELDVLGSYNVERVIIAACGTSYLSGLVAKYMIEEKAGIPVEVDLASEFRYRSPIMRGGDLLLVISQSGETADTLAAIEEAQRHDIPTVAIVNVVGSTIARTTDAVIYQHIGPEIGVASTKAFTAQTALMGLCTLILGARSKIGQDELVMLLAEFARIPELMRQVLKQDSAIAILAEKYKNYDNFLYLGRKYMTPVALEGALKLKEVSYIHAEGYAAGEMKHGPIAMIDTDFPSVVIATESSVYEKVISNMEEIRARGGPLIAIATEDDANIRHYTSDVIYIPKTAEMLTPLLAVIPLQLFAYHVGVLRGLDVDKPRNLAKSVTVE